MVQINAGSVQMKLIRPNFNERFVKSKTYRCNNLVSTQILKVPTENVRGIETIRLAKTLEFWVLNLEIVLLS